MSWFDEIVDFVSDNIFNIAGTAADYMASEQQQQASIELAQKQSAEISRIADENAKLQRYDASLAIEQAKKVKLATDFSYWSNNKMTDRLISTQTARYGKSGVAVGSGTPLKVAMETAKESERVGNIILNNGKSERDRLYSSATRLNYAADQTLKTAAHQVDILNTAMQDGLSIMEYQQWTTGAQNLFKIGERNEWWRDDNG